MNWIHQLIAAHPVTAGIVTATSVYWLFNAYVSSLEAPTAADSRRYRQWYRFLHSLAANLDRVAAAKLPAVVVDPSIPPASQK